MSDPRGAERSGAARSHRGDRRTSPGTSCQDSDVDSDSGRCSGTLQVGVWSVCALPKTVRGFCFLEVKVFVRKRVKCVAASVPNPTLLLLLLMKEAVVDNSQSVDVDLLSAATVSNLLLEGFLFRCVSPA